MNMRLINISFALFWLALFLGLMARDWWMPPWLLANAENTRLPLIIALTLLLAFWNFSKYWVSKRYAAPRSQVTPELKEKIRSITGVDHKVTDPQFKFDDTDAVPPR